jgi:hypothetical protein
VLAILAMLARRGCYPGRSGTRKQARQSNWKAVFSDKAARTMASRDGHNWRPGRGSVRSTAVGSTAVSVGRVRAGPRARRDRYRRGAAPGQVSDAARPRRIGEAVGRELRPLLEMRNNTSGIWVVVADAWSRVRRFAAEPMQHPGW